ncbi:MAG: substrate-binding domain-containing protein [Proteobacteria bacterium]|nr:substrate-binding domain-containing protein [Pseudomonadota bacterium]
MLALSAASCDGPANQADHNELATETTREVRVITSGGFTAAYKVLGPEFEAATGIRLVTAYGASSGGAEDSIPSRLSRGEPADVIILSRSSLDNLTAAAEVVADSRVDLVRSTIGMAVQSGAPMPDISTTDSFVASLLAADSIGYSASASGTYLSTVLFPQLGIWEQIEAKSKRILSERVATVVARGEVQIGFQQISEILPIEGIDYVGPIPKDVQKVTTFSAGITMRAENSADAQRLIDFLSSPEVADTIASTGLEPVASARKQMSDDFPNRPVTIVVGFGVGGSADRMTRSMSNFVGEELGQPVQVINKRGAGTLLASNYVLSRPHDGYTIYASGFSPYLSNSILEGNADFTIDDFAYLNFQWFDEDLIALHKDSQYKDLPELLEAIRTRPKTVRASVVRGSGGHLMAKLLLEVNGIPQENLNLVTYNGGGLARAAVAGGIVDYIVISAEGTESIREFIRPLAIVSEQRNPNWDVPTLNVALQPMDISVPILPGSIRGFAMTAEFKRNYPERFNKIAEAFKRALQNEELLDTLERSAIGSRWTGPEQSEITMRTTFSIFEDYSYLLKL